MPVHWWTMYTHKASGARFGLDSFVPASTCSVERQVRAEFTRSTTQEFDLRHVFPRCNQSGDFRLMICKNLMS